MKIAAGLCLILIIAGGAFADTLYFKDGRVLEVSRYWEENGTIHFIVKDVPGFVPKEKIIKIVISSSTGQKRVIKLQEAPNEMLLFFDPEREKPYCVSKTQRYSTRGEALRALAAEYYTTPAWVEQSMGDQNDLDSIRFNLNRQKDFEKARRNDPLKAFPTSKYSYSSPTTKDSYSSRSRLLFYDPQRPNPYLANEISEHRTRESAIRALAIQFGASPKWVERNMGSSNYLQDIHHNLSKAKLSEVW